MLIVMLWTQGALALDDTSLRARGSFGLFRDPVDFLVQPALMPPMDAWDVYVGVDGVADSGRVGGGGLGPLGAGRLGVTADASRSHSAQDEWVPSNNGYQGTLDREDSSDLEGRVGWSLPLGGRHLLGLQLHGSRFADTVSVLPEWWQSSLDYHTEGDQFWQDGQVVYSATGERQRLYRALDGSIGLGWRERGGLTLGLSRDRLTNSLDARIEDDAGTYQISGIDTSSPLELNYARWQPRLRGEWSTPLGDRLDLRLAGHGSAWWGQGVDHRTVMSGDVGDSSEERSWSLKDDHLRGAATDLLAALELRRDDLALRVGLRGSYAWDRQEWRSAWTQDGLQQEEAIHFEDGFTWVVRVPLAIEVPTTPRFTLRLGSQVAMYGADQLVGDPDDLAWADGASTSSYASSGASGVFGFRWEPVAAVSVDGQVSSGSIASTSMGIYSNTDLAGVVPTSQGYDLSEISLWATLHL